MANLLQVKFGVQEVFLRPNGSGGFTTVAAAGQGISRQVTGATLSLNWRRDIATTPAANATKRPASLELIARIKKPNSATDGYARFAIFPGKVTFVQGTAGVEPRFKGDFLLVNNQRVQTIGLSDANNVTRSDFFFLIAGDGTTVDLKNDPGPILLALPWLFEDTNPILQVNARLSVAEVVEADENSNTPLDVPLQHPAVPDEGVANDVARHPLLNYFGVRNIATLSNAARLPKIRFSGRTLRVFFHATFRAFCTEHSSASLVDIATAVTTILTDAGFAAVTVSRDTPADAECGRFFRPVNGRFMSRLIVDPDQSKRPEDRIENRFAAAIANNTPEAVLIPDTMVVRVPFFDFFIFAEQAEPPNPNELAHSEGAVSGGILPAAAEKLLVTPTIIATGLGSGTPLRALLARVETTDHLNVLASTIAHEIGHSFGLRHNLAFPAALPYRMGDPQGLQRGVMAPAGTRQVPGSKDRSPLLFFGPVHQAMIRKLFF